MNTLTHRIPGLVLADRHFRVPRDHADSQGIKIEIFAREVVAPGREHDDLPWLVFFQGGPGNASPRPLGRDGWLKRALQEYRVLLLDQRGTGRSTPVTTRSLTALGSPQAIAAYLKLFRADSIVRDAECIRRELLGANGRWSILGQSYGGFCVLRYLSAAPESLREAFVTGGLPPLERSADEVYRATYRRVRANNHRYYERYAGDIERVHAIAALLARKEFRLPRGDRLSPRRFQQLGGQLGAHEGFETLHYLLEEAFTDSPNGDTLSYAFLRGFEDQQRFDTHPLYAILHEAIYTQRTASRWAAERVRAEYPEFEISPDRPVYFTGEMIYPWQFDELGALRPLKEAAELLAATDDWPMLYDPVVLRQNTVPCAAAIYVDDMYVESTFSEETTQSIRGLRAWVTNQYQHNAIRYDGEVVFSHLLGMLHGEL